MKVLVTGSSGLIGSEAVVHFDHLGHFVYGLDNNMRRQLFGESADTTPNLERLRTETTRFSCFDVDIRSRDAILAFVKEHRVDLVIHCAAQPSHAIANQMPFTDFDINAGGTLNLLEAVRLFCPEAVFVLMSSNKVYGDAPNELPLIEREKRWDYARTEDFHGIPETCRTDQSLHSVFGVSKLAADVMTQEYGKSFGIRTGVFRAGCLTGPRHSGAQMHGFLSYLVRSIVGGKSYTIYGYKGKQVRDQIHSKDVVLAVEAFAMNPRPGEVYNLGGGRENSASILECIDLIQDRISERISFSYSPEARTGDHICYISDTRKFRGHYPKWSIQHSLQDIVREMIEWERRRPQHA